VDPGVLRGSQLGGRAHSLEGNGGSVVAWAHYPVLGVAGDMVYALRLSNAVLESWSATSGREIDRLELRRYFESAPVREEVIPHPSTVDHFGPLGDDPFEERW